MNTATLEKIKVECEKITLDSGFGEVVIKIQDGCIFRIISTYSRMIEKDMEVSCQKLEK